MKIFDRACHHLYVVALIVAAAILLLAPLHLQATVDLPIVDTLPNATVRFVPQAGKGPSVGEEIHYFRFSGEWVLPVGLLRVLGNHPDGGMVAQAVDSTFRFPMGIQGSIIWQSQDRRQLRINVGKDVGLEQGMNLQLFDGKKSMGPARVMQVGNGDAELVYLVRSAPFVVGCQASIYTVPNSVSYLANPWLSKIEWVVAAIVVLTLLCRSVLPKMWEKLINGLGRAVAFIASPRRFWTLILAPPLLYYIVRFLLRSWDHVVRSLANLARQPWLDALSRSEQYLLFPALIAAGIAFLWVFAETGRSPWRILRDKTLYHPPSFDGRATRVARAVGFDRVLIVWLLQVIVVYAFAHTLVGVLAANIRVMTILAYPQIQPDMSNFRSAMATLTQLLHTTPTYYTAAVAAQAVNLFIFSVTIVGSLVGYLYGVVSIFWGKESVRNVDFTVTGWLVNANCYGPLLGVAIWGMFPDLFGSRPGVVDGPLHYAGIWCGLLLNVLYSLSIYNMWTRFGVMVDKGVCKNLMFSVVRHPCYTLEGVMFAILSLHHVPSLSTFISIAIYSFLYWIRSERDEDFMLASNAEYADYRKQVVYKYLPGLV